MEDIVKVEKKGFKDFRLLRNWYANVVEAPVPTLPRFLNLMHLLQRWRFSKLTTCGF
jgi:hypothetical protein